jgi:hypothetical protein
MNAKEFVQIKPYCITYQTHCAMMTGIIIILSIFYAVKRKEEFLAYGK